MKAPWIKVCAAIIACGGILVLIGWTFDIQMLTSISPGLSTMKPSTAVSFIATGILLFALDEFLNGRKDPASIFIAGSALVMLLIMTTHFISYLIGQDTGLEFIFFRSQDFSFSATVGRPTFQTMISFIGIAVVGLCSLLSAPLITRVYLLLGTALCVIGTVSLVGLALGISELVRSVTGMAAHASALLIVTGFAFVLLSRQRPLVLPS